jgi:hypothetical protein
MSPIVLKNNCRISLLWLQRFLRTDEETKVISAAN